jgi:hypothetical protein
VLIGAGVIDDWVPRTIVGQAPSVDHTLELSPAIKLIVTARTTAPRR